jgi:hypothetical protein
MEFLEPIANLLGVTVTQMIIVAALCLGLVIAWYVVKAVVKLTAKMFTIGCFTIIVIGAALYVFFAFFQ